MSLSFLLSFVSADKSAKIRIFYVERHFEESLLEDVLVGSRSNAKVNAVLLNLLKVSIQENLRSTPLLQKDVHLCLQQTSS